MDKSEEFYRKSLSLNNNNPSRLNALAWFLIENNRDIDEGMELIQKALEKDPENYYFIDTRGWGLYKQGKYIEALELLEKGWSLKTFYDHDIFLHLQEVRKTVSNQK
jgi:tetratricopeptide (TPR) repeat protein